MTATEFRVILAQLGLKPGQAAELLKTTTNSVRCWARGERPVPDLVSEYLALRFELAARDQRWRAWWSDARSALAETFAADLYESTHPAPDVTDPTP